MYGEEVTFSGLPVELRRRRRLLVLVIGLIVLLGAGIVAMLALSPGARPAATRPDPGGGVVGVAPLPEPDGPGAQSGEGQTSGAPGGVGQPGDGGQPGGGNSDGGGDPSSPPQGPCANAQRALVGSPDPVRLKPGVTKGSFTIYNCTDEAVPWMAATKPSVTLGHESGTLDPGEEFKLSFSVDASKFETQQFTFKIKVYGATTNFFYIDVYGSKLVVLPH